MRLKTLTILVVFCLINNAPLTAQERRDERVHLQRGSNSEKPDRKFIELKAAREKLQVLDQNYISKLRTRDAESARRLIDDIYELLDKAEDNIKNTSHFPPQPVAVSSGQFADMLKSIKREPFEDNRLAVIQSIAERNFFTVAQTTEVIKVCISSEEKVKALEILYPKVTDKSNGYKLINEFNFSGDKERVQHIINQP